MSPKWYRQPYDRYFDTAPTISESGSVSRMQWCHYAWKLFYAIRGRDVAELAILFNDATSYLLLRKLEYEVVTEELTQCWIDHRHLGDYLDLTNVNLDGPWLWNLLSDSEVGYLLASRKSQRTFFMIRDLVSTEVFYMTCYEWTLADFRLGITLHDNIEQALDQGVIVLVAENSEWKLMGMHSCRQVQLLCDYLDLTNINLDEPWPSEEEYVTESVEQEDDHESVWANSWHMTLNVSSIELLKLPFATRESHDWCSQNERSMARPASTQTFRCKPQIPMTWKLIQNTTKAPKVMRHQQ